MIAVSIWSFALVAGFTLLALGVLFAIVLLIAHEKLKVEVDPKIERIHQALPNIDCGACGYAGCGSYAKAVAANPELIGKCAPGGKACSDAIAAVLNIQAGGDGAAPLRAVIHCRAHIDDKTFYGSYEGIESCISANAMANVQACKFGCLGFGDCVKACKFDALHVIDGLATVDYDKCTGCTACAKACPRDLIEMVAFTHENMMSVACSNKESGKNTRAMCKVGCIACGICTKQSDLFKVEENLARMDYKNYEPSEKTQTACDKCPTGVIVFRGPTAPQPREAGQKPAVAAKATV